MSSVLNHRLGNLYDPPELNPQDPLADLLALSAQRASIAPVARAPVITAEPELKPKALKRRSRIWELNTNLHCSIVGTCLAAGELRRLLTRLNIKGLDTADEHELHMLGVLLANRPQEGGKHLQKALDRRHQVAINQFAKARNDAAVALLWQKAVTGGDIPGAYWATLTHPESSDKLVQKAFADVHMMSHLMGATNCADLQRMRRLEDELTALHERLDRQQRHLHDGFTERDAQISRLSAMLAEKMQHRTDPSMIDDEAATLKEAVAQLGERLARETARRERLEQRLAGSEQIEAARRRAEAERDELRKEHAVLEHHLNALLASDDAGLADLGGATVLYLGGRPNQLPRFKAMIERAGGQLIHHDGGVEDAAALLPGLVSRSDVTVFPVDCVSHSAVASAKRLCQQLDKRYLPLRTSSLACLLAALATLERPVMAGA